MRPTWRVTVRQLLNLTSGLEPETDGAGGEADGAAARLPEYKDDEFLRTLFGG